MPGSPPRVSTTDRQAAVLGWTRIEKPCTACGQRTPAGALDGHGQCPTCAARNETSNPTGTTKETP